MRFVELRARLTVRGNSQVMDTKLCARCKEPKPLDAFYKRPKSGAADSHCRPCNTEVKREWRAANPDKRREAHRRERKRQAASGWPLAKARRAKLTDYVDGIKLQRGCADCGWRPADPRHAAALEFDHVPGRGEKRESVGRLVGASRGRERIDEEIEKCDVVCTRCHRIRTIDRGWFWQGKPGWHGTAPRAGASSDDAGSK